MPNFSQVKKYCLQSDIKLTDLRKDILQLICEAKSPMGAYQILRLLREQKPTAEPPTVYRVLEFLQEQRLIHRVESNNAYILCQHLSQHRNGQLLICKSCGVTKELQDEKLTKILSDCAELKGFYLSNDLAEIRGLCSHCYQQQEQLS